MISIFRNINKHLWFILKIVVLIVSFFKFYLNTLITNNYYFFILIIVCIPVHYFINRIIKFKIDDSFFMSYVYTIFFTFFIFFPITKYCSWNKEIHTYKTPLINFYFLKGSYNITFEFKDISFTRIYKKSEIDKISDYEVVLKLREAFTDFYIIEKMILEKKNDSQDSMADSIE